MSVYLYLTYILLQSANFASDTISIENDPKATVILQSRNCHYEHGTNISNIEVFKNGEFLYSVEPFATKGYKVTMDSLERGNYRFRYSNIFYQKIDETLEIKENKTYTIQLCVERFGERNQDFQGLIDSVTPNTPLIIQDHFYGCFRNQKSKLTIYLKDNKYYATLIRYQDSYKKSRGFKKQTIALTADKIRRIREFEEELPFATQPAPMDMMFPNEGDNFKFKLGEVQRKLTLSRAGWVGYYELVEHLFNSKKIWD